MKIQRAGSYLLHQCTYRSISIEREGHVGHGFVYFQEICKTLYIPNNRFCLTCFRWGLQHSPPQEKREETGVYDSDYRNHRRETLFLLSYSRNREQSSRHRQHMIVRFFRYRQHVCAYRQVCCPFRNIPSSHKVRRRDGDAV